MSTISRDGSSEEQSGAVDDDATQRIRTLTIRGQALYEESRDWHTRQIKKFWSTVDAVIDTANSLKDNNLQELQEVQRELTLHVDQFSALCTLYLEFLTKYNTNESLQEKSYFETTFRGYKILIDASLRSLRQRISDALRKDTDRGSVSSSRRSGAKTSSSRNTSTSSVYLKSKAKAEAAKVRLQYVQEEAELKKKQANLDEQFEIETAKFKAAAQKEKAELNAELEVLAYKKEVAAAEAEVEVLQSEGSDERTEISCSGIKSIASKRTQAYVAEQSSLKLNSVLQPGPEFEIPYMVPSTRNEPQKLFDIPYVVPSVASEPLSQTDQIHEETPIMEQAEIQNKTIEKIDNSVTSDLTRFLLKKELLLSRLINFNDKPEFYCTWKSSFTNIMTELQVTPIEEIDMLVKWTGLESRQHVLNIKSSNPSNPTLALSRIWERLEDRYGCPEMVEAAIRSKLNAFPTINVKENKRLYELSDLVSEIESLKLEPKFKSSLAMYDSSIGVIPIVSKLPRNIQEKWTNTAGKFMKDKKVIYPPFECFAEFLREQSKIKNNPSFMYEYDSVVTNRKEKGNSRNVNVATKKTELQGNSRSTEKSRDDKQCPIHNTNHTLNKCRAFRNKPIDERRKLLKDKNICFRCCESNTHIQRNCPSSGTVKCDICSSNHATALHVDNFQRNFNTPPIALSSNGGESAQNSEPNSSTPVVKAMCSQVCGDYFSGKSCAKTVLVTIYQKNQRANAVKTYALIDDQSNRSLMKPELSALLNAQGEEISYTLSSCSGKVNITGKKISNLIVESLDANVALDLPPLIECDGIPNIRSEIPTPEIAAYYNHLWDIASNIPQIDENCEILLLLGRDIIEAHHVMDQRIGPRGSPYAQKLPLGWTIIGETCLDKTHVPEVVNVNKTFLVKGDRPSLVQPCVNAFEVYEKDSFGKNVFQTTNHDDKIAMSIDDKEFLKIMGKEFKQDDDKNWIAPLPFREDRQRLPNNEQLAMKRARSLDHSLRRDQTKMQHFLTFMAHIFENGHAELAPELDNNSECWYLPIFGVYHPKKPDQLRAVFDSSAKYGGVSLNDVLLSGPDLANSLIGVLMRFRKDQVAVIGDIRQMFYCFRVSEDHRDYLRFLWYKDNNPSNELTKYRMCVHAFGNSPSPAIATYGLRKTAALGENVYGSDVKDYIENNFYVDDGLISLPSASEAISLMKRSKDALEKIGNIELHKIASNNKEVMNAFPQEELAKNLKEIDLDCDRLPSQRSLGINWDLDSDSFTFQIDSGIKPFTRRGVLSTINSIYDPLGFIAPVVIKGKLLMRSLIQESQDWDSPLSPQQYSEWKDWKTSLVDLEHVKIPRTYFAEPYSSTLEKTIHIFSDASEKAIGAVAYLSAQRSDHDRQYGFVLGKAKVAPSHGHTIPRLELCAAVLAIELAESVTEHLDIPPEKFRFFTDSKVVLGYISNDSRRFYTYVANRVAKIRKFSKASQWSYVHTGNNPADQATRSIAVNDLQTSMWLHGLTRTIGENSISETEYQLQDPSEDKEVRNVSCLKTKISDISNMGSQRFDRFSDWNKLVGTIARLQHIVDSYQGKASCHHGRGWHLCGESLNLVNSRRAEINIIKAVQEETYTDELLSCVEGKNIPANSPLVSLNPFVDQEGILRVGGRLSHADIEINEKHPIIIPGKHHIATLLIRKFHHQVKHQGRLITNGAIRTGGYWITGSKRIVSSMIHKCIICRKLRGKLQFQKMADLPVDRLEPGPPFTYVGVDCFGPWEIVTRKTRGGAANSKRWAALFTCLTTRGIHIEVLEEMSSSSFINAFRRFTSIRGQVKQIRSDCGTNFVGATNELKIDTIRVDDDNIKDCLYKSGATWVFNAPHSSHMGGIWERMIGVTRRVLDSILLENVKGGLTHEVLITLLAEVTAIVNCRPLVEVSTDPEDPIPLTPAMLLTQKPNLITIENTFDMTNMYRAQWKRVQVLADMFWRKWRVEYLQTLQKRRKWQTEKRDISVGDLVLLKDNSVHRCSWPVGIITDTFPSQDKRVRKVALRIIRKDGERVSYIRPITELVVLIETD
ncbi:uncharacterized protein LOC134681506 [Mytilus trossulus]|uniref:uncharacterized protein LOC134681506 n=1 Tax=Mytilus trossulus TaxID=6551 RepID=UPI0030054E28